MPYTLIPNLKVLVPRNASRDADAVYYAERADHVNTPAAGFGELWARNDAPSALIYTNDIGADLQLLGDPIPLGSWNFNASTIGTPASMEFDTDNATLSLTTQIRVTGTASNEGWARTWLENLPAPGYLVVRKKGAPSEEVIFTYETLTDTAGAYTNFNVLNYLSDTTADSAWATDDEWVFYVHPDNNLVFTERADHSIAPVAGKAELWARNDAPNTLIFTNDAGDDIAVAAMMITFNGTWDGTGVADEWYYSISETDGTWTNNSGSSGISTAITGNWEESGIYFPNGGRILSAHYAMATTVAATGNQVMEWEIRSTQFTDNMTSGTGGQTSHVTFGETFTTNSRQIGTATIETAAIDAGDSLKVYVRQTNNAMTGGADLFGTITLMVEVYQ